MVIRRGKKLVVRVAECVAALIPVHRTLSLFPNTYSFFDPSSIFIRFSVQNFSRRPIDHVVVVKCMVSQSWFVLFRQTRRTLLPGKRFTTYDLYFRLVFFQSCAIFSSSFSYLTFLTVSTWNSVYAINDFFLHLFVRYGPLCTKFESSSFSHSWDMDGAPKI